MHQLPTGTVTFLFTDIEGSTGVLTECRDLLRAAFQAYSGQEVDTQGDAFFVAFAHATDAVSAAVADQRAIPRRTCPDGVAVRVGMGLHTGEPQLSSIGYVGLDVDRAARTMNRARWADPDGRHG